MGNTTSSFRTLPIRDRGVRLEVAIKVMNGLTDDHYKIAKMKLGKDPSPGEVIVHGYVKEETDRKSLAVHLMEDPLTAPLVGRCNVFLSHTWGTPFADTVAAIKDYEDQLDEDSPICYYFIDFFSINQVYPSSDLEELGALAKSCGTLLLFAKPWRRPAALGRAWCIFELAHGLLGGANLVLGMAKGEEGLLMKAIGDLRSSGSAAKFLNIFGSIDTSKMEATYEKDLKKISDFMEENLGGFHSVDQLVSSSLRKWVGNMAMTFCESFSPKETKEHALFLNRAGYLFTKIGLWECQLISSQNARKISEQLKLERLVEMSMVNEALALEYLQRYDEAVELYKEGIKNDIKKYGLIHPLTLNDRRNLGDLYVTMKKWDEAEIELSAALKGFKAIRKPMSIEIRGAQDSMARLLRDSGKDIKRAELLYKEVLVYETKVFGSENAFVLLSLVQHARCLALQGEHMRAVTSYKRALPVMIKAFGNEDVDVVELRAWIGEVNEDLDGKTEM